MTTFTFIPGLLSDALVWQAVADALPEGTPVHMADVTRADTIPRMAADILAAVDGPLVAIGHSMGGRVAMEVARQAPDRTRALVLANTGHVPLKPGEEANRREMVELGHADMSDLAATWLPPMLDAARTGDGALMSRLTAMVLRAGPEVHDRQIGALIRRPDAGAYLPSIACPILLLTGRQDRWSPVPQHEEIAALAPDATLRVIENAGHFAPVERPETTTREILGWLHQRGLL